MLRKFLTVFITLGVLVGGGLLIALMGALRPEIERQEPVITPPTVFYTVAEEQSVTLDVYAQGEVRPRTDITLTPQVSGRIVRVSDKFVNGGAFDKGDLLVKIEDADYRLAVTSAKALVAQAEEALRREEAESTLAQRDWEELGEQGEPSALTLRLPQLAQARARYEAARADLRVAELNLERTSIRAPFKGRVRSRQTGEGQYVSPGLQLGTIFSTDIAEIRLSLTDSDLAKLGLPIAFVESEDNPGPEVTLTATVAGREHVWRGRIARGEGAINPATRQTAAIAVVDDPYGEGADDGTPLAIGLYVSARIRGKPYDGAIVLPSAALHGRDGVYVIADDGALERRTVSVVSSARDSVTIIAGVSPGERVVTSPLRGAGEGDKVTPSLPIAPSGADSDTEDEAIAETADDEATASEVAEAVKDGGRL
ncbi:MAG: efflux RND transporter periplasmic adaptor subunit [Parvularculaceae bacterium]